MPTARVNGVELYYEVHGHGLPLVLSHTGFTSVENWIDVIPTLSQHYQVIVYDRRGCGHSTPKEVEHSPELWVQDLYELLNKLDVHHCYMAGVSYGSFLTLEFVLSHPEMVDASIIICGTTRGYGMNNPNAVVFPDRQSRLGELKCPTLLVHGSNDEGFPPALGEEAQGLIANSELLIIPDVGHSPQKEDPQAFNSAVLGFLEKQRKDQRVEDVP